MKTKIIYIAPLLLILLIVIVFQKNRTKESTQNIINRTNSVSVSESNPLAITAMREKAYPGSNVTIEQELADGENYKQYIASYLSDGLKIYGLLTMPIGNTPKGGWPVIIFNHGYIPPSQYVTTERYVNYVAAFASNGYVVFKSDYRGNGQSQGQPEGAYYSPAYATDVLNAMSSLKKYPGVNPNKIGMWGHSMGGNITLRCLVVDPKDIKVAVIWGGVVGTYNDLLYNWQRRVTYQPPPNELALRNRYRSNLVEKYGSPSANPTFWNSIDPNSFLFDITAPVQLDAGEQDEEVPVAFSQGLYDRLKKLGKTTEIYIYPGENHNINGPYFEEAIQRSISFFDKYLK